MVVADGKVCPLFFIVNKLYANIDNDNNKNTTVLG
jgi:hypothetical protein